eukprot:TRINITY_DN13008_c0_g1_i1.p1 TRINITY_DN13008_c0_g1~~TRINITY_DN13008_c0_g1_i1.p1  ORF type:complete len:156 (+),score=44.98 TRINITY_DN13008_c0_g1_i1:29-496(+)
MFFRYISLRQMYFFLFFFFNDTATTEIYTLHIVGSVRCVQETGINAEYMGPEVLAEKIEEKYFLEYFYPEILQALAKQNSDVFSSQLLDQAYIIIKSYFSNKQKKIQQSILDLSLIHISEPTRLGMISYAVFCLKKKKQKNTSHSINPQQERIDP